MDQNRQLLKNRNYSLLLSTELFATVGMSMQTTTVAVLVADLTDSAFWTSLASVGAFVAIGLASPFAGRAVDRYDSRQVLRIGSGLQSLIALALAVMYMTDSFSAATLTAVLSLEGFIMGATDLARRDLMTDVVAKSEVISASGLMTAASSVGWLIGAPLAGAAIAFGLVESVFAFNTAALVGVSLATFAIRDVISNGRAPDLRRSRSFTSDLKLVLTEPNTRLAIMILTMMSLCIAPFLALFPAMAQIALGGEPSDTSKLFTASAIGGVIGSLVLGPLVNRFGDEQVARVSVIALPFALFGYALSQNMFQAASMGAVTVALYILMLTYLRSTIQVMAPVAVRGRSLGLAALVLAVLYPLGSTLAGIVGDATNVRLPLAIGAVCFMIALGVLRLRVPTSTAKSDHSPEVTPDFKSLGTQQDR